MFGQNVTRGHDNEQRKDALQVVAIFPTIQGEGPLAGTPAVFVRLAHCNLKCYFCDTDFTSNVRDLTADEVAEEVQAVSSGSCSLVVVTGGEPFRQPLHALTRALMAYGFDVQFETAGSLDPHPADPDGWLEETVAKHDADIPNVSVVISPKTPKLSKVFTALACSAERNVALKYIVKAGEGRSSVYDGLPLFSTQRMDGGKQPWRPSDVLGAGVCTVYVQPMDEHEDEEATRANVQHAVEVATRFGYRLSLQQHKILGLP